MGIPLWLISLAVGVLAALLVVTVMKNQLKTVRRQPNAASYVRSDGLMLTVSQDVFLYERTTRTAKSKNKK